MAETIFVATAGGMVEVGGGTRDFRGSDVAVVEKGENEWWALVDRQEIWIGSPGDWRRLATVKAHRLTCLLPTSGGALVGTSEARLLRVDGNGAVAFVDEFDALEERTTWYTPWGGPPDVRSIARARDGALLVNVHVGGILRTEDDGKSFRPTIDIGSDVHEVITHDGSILAATAQGLATSPDAGASWGFETEGLHATYCRAVATTDNAVLVSASVGPYGGRAAIYSRPLSGGELRKCNSGLPEWFGDNIDTGCLAAAGDQAAFATSDGRVFSSLDGGANWTEVASGLEPARRVVIAPR